MTMLRPYAAVLCFISLISLSAQSSHSTLSIGSECETYEIHHVNNDQTYTIEWDGGKIPNYCTIGFIGRDSGYMNEYKVCVEADEWDLSDCRVKVKYQKGIGSHLAEEYSCDDDPPKWCGDADDYVDIQFSFKDSSHQSPSDGDIRLKITAKMTYNYNLTVGLAVGGTVGGIFFFVVCVVVLARTNRLRSNVRRPIVLTAGYTGNTPSQGLSNPVMYSTASGKYPSNELPPSYQSVVNSPLYTQPTTQPS